MTTSTTLLAQTANRGTERHTTANRGTDRHTTVHIHRAEPSALSAQAATMPVNLTHTVPRKPKPGTTGQPVTLHTKLKTVHWLPWGALSEGKGDCGVSRLLFGGCVLFV